MRRIRIKLSQDIFLKHYKDLGIRTVYVHPGYDVDANYAITTEPTEIEVTDKVYEDIKKRDVHDTLIFDIEDVEAEEKVQEQEAAKAEEEYKERQKRRGK
jgi:hypothetical protein